MNSNEIVDELNNMQDYQRSGYSIQQQYVINIANTAINMLKSTGTKEQMIAEANAYADTVGMNQANRDLLVILKTEGDSAMIKQAFVDPHDSTRQLSYSEMRALYG